jgi:hypothetical protein
LPRFSFAVILAAFALAALPAAASAKKCSSSQIASGSACVPQLVSGANGVVTIYKSRPKLVFVALPKPLAGVCTSEGVASPRQFRPRDLRILFQGYLTGKTFSGALQSGGGISFVSGRYVSKTKVEVTVRFASVAGSRTPTNPIGSVCSVPPTKLTISGSASKSTPIPAAKAPVLPKSCPVPYFKAGTLCTAEALTTPDAGILAQRQFKRTIIAFWKPIPLNCTSGPHSTNLVIFVERGSAPSKITGRFGDASEALVTIDGSYTGKKTASVNVNIGWTSTKLGTCTGSARLALGAPPIAAGDFINAN